MKNPWRDAEVFQSTLPRRERPQWARKSHRNRRFQSTLPRRERHATGYDVLTAAIFQSTLPRRERLRAICKAMSIDWISIHAPAKGATGLCNTCRYRRSDFNPRSREGSDKQFPDPDQHYAISIHAPAKGATYPHASCLFVDLVFQSTLPRRERRISGVSCV